jgi:hypothetical protein
MIPNDPIRRGKNGLSITLVEVTESFLLPSQGSLDESFIRDCASLVLGSRTVIRQIRRCTAFNSRPLSTQAYTSIRAESEDRIHLQVANRTRRHGNNLQVVEFEKLSFFTLYYSCAG